MGFFNNPDIRVEEGSYSGNGTQNRDISHGLGKIPKLIFVFGTSGGNQIQTFWVSGTVGTWSLRTQNNDTIRTMGLSNVGTSTFRVGADATGGTMNVSGYAYYFVAVG